jgi:hypothetical protein
MKVQIGLFAEPEKVIEQINELLKPEGLWICTTEEQEDDEPESVAYEILHCKVN